MLLIFVAGVGMGGSSGGTVPAGETVEAIGALPLGEFAFSYLVSATAPTLCVRVTYRSSVQTVGYQSSVRTVAYGSSTVRAYYGDRP